VSREEIRQAIWDADTHVDFEQGINWCVRQLRKALDDDAEDPRFIETLAKQGYRLIAPCSIAQEEKTPRTTQRFLFGWKAALAAVAVVAVIAAAYRGVDRRPPTVLLLPIDNFSGDARVDSLANARTDFLIASLGSDPKQLRVIDRPTAAKFKSTGECIIKMGRQLKADYVFVGSIEESSGEPRLSGGLFRVADNTQVWTTAAGVNPLDDKDIGSIPKAIAAAARR
jgi:TolB-like protein